MSAVLNTAKEYAAAGYHAVEGGFNILKNDVSALISGRCFREFKNMSNDDRAGVILKTILAALVALFFTPIGSLILSTLVFAHSTNPDNQKALNEVVKENLGLQGKK